MAMVLYALGVWILVSVPVALFLGAVCSLNQLSQDGGELLNPDALAHRHTEADARGSGKELAAAA